jgi:amino acid adenylation domain-containing protein/non-ribosomal peptide synthase protein (TIGR01720 family)
MRIIELIKQIKNQGINIKLDSNENLVIHGKNISSELMQILKIRKDEIISLLKGSSEARQLLPKLEKCYEMKDKFSITNSQMRLWIASERSNEPSLYVIRAAFELKGSIDEEKLIASIDKVLKKHRILNSYFEESSGEVYQCLRTSLKISEYFQRINCNKENLDYQIQEYIDKPLRLDGVLFHVALLSVSTTHHILILKVHHLISDGFSMSIIFNEISDYYNSSNIDNTNSNFLDYLDYSNWEKTPIVKEYFNKNVKVWTKHLQDTTELDFPKTTIAAESGKLYGDSHSFMVNQDISDSIRKRACEMGVTPYVIYLSAFYIMISLICRSKEVALGIPSANRFIEEANYIVGLFVNTIPFKVTLVNECVENIITKVNNIFNEMHKYHSVPYNLIYSELSSKNKKANFLKAIFNYVEQQNESLILHDINVKPLPTKTKFSPNLINFSIKTNNQQTTGIVDYDKGYFTSGSIEKFCQLYDSILKLIIEKSSVKLDDIAILNEKENNFITNNFNNTEKNFSNILVPDLIINIFTRDSQNIAILADDRKVTYSQLKTNSSKIASYLQSRGIKNNDLVVVILDRSVNRVAALTGILLSGAAYVPIESSIPSNRLLDILEDAKPKIIITQSGLSHSLENTGSEIVLLEDILLSDSAPFSKVSYQPDDLAYVIYTSGSTGKPKGVLIQHKGLCNRLLWMQDIFNITQSDRIMQKTPYSFDVSVWEFFWPLITGSTIVVIKENGHKDPEYIAEQINRHSVSVIHFVPSMLSVFLKLVKIDKFPSLKKIICSGEALQRRDVNYVLSKSNIELFNLYGPTEASIDVTFHQCYLSSDDMPVAIGKPISNMKTYILDNNLNPVPIGFTGELHLSGIGLAVGYLNRPELTLEKFIDNPYASINSNYSKLYKTGDLVKYDKEGNIYYLGRTDNQIKLRGLRIELGEIETVLASFPGIQQTLLIVSQIKGNQHLVAYYSAKNKFNNNEIREFLSTKLPEYMLPTYFVYLPFFPINKNGKTDRNEIIKLPIEIENQEQIHQTPRNKLEVQIHEIWCEVLGLDKISIYDDFFHLGGDSISLMNVLARLRVNKIYISLKHSFSKATIESMASYSIENQSPNMIARSGQTQKLTPIQIRFFNSEYKNVNYYNQLFRLKVNKTINIDKLHQAIDYLIKYHDVFSLKFIKDENNCWYSEYNNDNSYLFKSHDLTSLPAAEQKSKLLFYGNFYNSSLDISKGPLINFIHFKLSENDERILIVSHHLIIDGVSWRILVEDLSKIYSDLFEGCAPSIEFEKSCSYQHWGNEISQIKISPESQLYWQTFKNKEVDIITPDHYLGENNYATNTQFKIYLDKITTDKLLTHCVKKNNVQINALLLAPLLKTFKDIMNLYNLQIDLESHGRNALNELDVTRTFGWFTDIYPIIIDNNTSSFAALLKHCNSYLEDASKYGPDYQLLHFRDMKHKTMRINKSCISFNYLGQFSNKIFSNTIFSMGDEYYGFPIDSDNIRSHKINIVIVVIDGKLRIDWNFSTNLFTQLTIEKLAKSYKENLLILCKEGD